MKADDYFLPFAKDAYLVYAKKAGADYPKSWEKLTGFEQDGWVEAVKEVFRKLQVSDSETGELYVE